MSFFRANLIGLKADRDKKEIGTARLAYSCTLAFRVRRLARSKMARGLAREQSRAKGAGKDHFAKKSDDGMTPAQRNER